MQVHSYSKARQKLTTVLKQAEITGKVLIRRKDGRTSALIPEIISDSSLDAPLINATITTDEIVDMIREGRERQNNRFHKGPLGPRGLCNATFTSKEKEVIQWTRIQSWMDYQRN